jgi:GNAT superfamily N-acetyltransferase
MQPDDIERLEEILLNESIRIYNFIRDPVSFRSARLPVFRNETLKAKGYVYEEDRLIKGFMTMIDNYILELFVDSQFHRKGIGTKLLNRAKHRRTSLALHVYEQNSDAIKFYKRHGFEEDGVHIEPDTGQPKLKMIWKKE